MRFPVWTLLACALAANPRPVAPLDATASPAYLFERIFSLAARDDAPGIEQHTQHDAQSVHDIGRGGRTPLHVAAAAGSSRAFVALLRAGSSVSARDAQAKTPIHLAASSGHSQLIAAYNEFRLTGKSDDEAQEARRSAGRAKKLKKKLLKKLKAQLLQQEISKLKRLLKTDDGYGSLSIPKPGFRTLLIPKPPPTGLQKLKTDDSEMHAVFFGEEGTSGQARRPDDGSLFIPKPRFRQLPGVGIPKPGFRTQQVPYPQPSGL